MANLTVYQRNVDQIFDRNQEYAVLDTVSWTINTDGEKTTSSSSKSLIKVIMQDITADDRVRITAGHLPKSDAVVLVPRSYTLNKGKYLDGATTKQMFIHYPGDGSTTPPSAAKKYEITSVEVVPHPADKTPDNSSGANKLYTTAFLKEVQATG